MATAERSYEQPRECLDPGDSAASVQATHYYVSTRIELYHGGKHGVKGGIMNSAAERQKPDRRLVLGQRCLAGGGLDQAPAITQQNHSFEG